MTIDLTRLREKQRNGWQSGRQLMVEDLLGGNSANSLEEDDLLELIYSEICLREELGGSARLAEYTNRFPRLAGRLERIFEMNEAFHDNIDSAEGAVTDQFATLSELTSWRATPSDVSAAIQSEVDTSEQEGANAKHDTVRIRCPICDTLVKGTADSDHTSQLMCESCGERLTVQRAATHPISAAPPKVPKTVGRYQIREQLGRGGFGVVYRAWDPELEREVAIKIPHKGMFTNAGMRDRFVREARALAALRHESICPIHDIQKLRDGRMVLCLAFIEGQPLSRLIEIEGHLSSQRVVRIVVRIAAAMQVAHDAEILHRDLKPANILVMPQDTPVVTDFGLVRRLPDPSQTQTGAIMGTPAYMSPEQAAGKVSELTPATDIYALGVILYELLTGQRPFHGSASELLAQVLRDEAVPPSEVKSDVTPCWDDVCRRAMAKRPKQRYQSMAEFANAVENASVQPSSMVLPRGIGAEIATTAASDAFPEQTEFHQQTARKPTTHLVWRYFVAAVGLVAIVATGLVLWRTELRRGENKLVEIVRPIDKINRTLVGLWQTDGGWRESFFPDGGHWIVRPGQPIDPRRRYVLDYDRNVLQFTELDGSQSDVLLKWLSDDQFDQHQPWSDRVIRFTRVKVRVKASEGVPDDLKFQLEQNKRFGVQSVSFSSQGGWVLLYNWLGSMGAPPGRNPKSLDEYIIANGAHANIQATAMASSDAWLVITERETRHEGDVPQDLLAFLDEKKKAGKRVSAIDFNSEGGWFAVADGPFWGGNLAPDLLDYVNEQRSAGKTIVCAGIASKGAWVVVTED